MTFSYRYTGAGPAEFPSLVLFDDDGIAAGSILEPGDTFTLTNEISHPQLVKAKAKKGGRHGFAVDPIQPDGPDAAETLTVSVADIALAGEGAPEGDPDPDADTDPPAGDGDTATADGGDADTTKEP